MTINERIALVISTLELNPNSFSTRLNISSTVIHNILKGRNYPSYEVLSKILTTFDNISSEWLILERGKMFINDNKKGIKAQQINESVGTQTNHFTHSENEWKLMERLLADKEKQLQEKDKMIEMLLKKSN